ncbi:MAG: DUF502 domain-containing protein [bacterium]
MKSVKNFIKTALLGGLVVILPVAVLVGIFSWILKFVTGKIQPLTDLIIAKSQLKEYAADMIAVIIILFVCFMVGILVKTKLGGFIYKFFESVLLLKIPGYTLVKETVLQFIGGKKSPFSSVALANIFGNQILATCFVTDEHGDGSCTVFVPTGPNPTSGNIYHLESKFVHRIEIPVEVAMKSIISCGAGSSELIKKYR